AAAFHHFAADHDLLDIKKINDRRDGGSDVRSGAFEHKLSEFVLFLCRRDDVVKIYFAVGDLFKLRSVVAVIAAAGPPNDVRRRSNIFEPCAVRIYRNISEFARESRNTAPQFAVKNERAADAVAERYVKHTARPAARAEFVFGVCRGIRV